MENNKKNNLIIVLVIIGIFTIFSGCTGESQTENTEDQITSTPTVISTQEPTSTPTPTPTVISTQVPTSTPTSTSTEVSSTPTSTPTPTPSIIITSPNGGDIVPWRYIIEGTSNGVYGSSNLNIYILIYPVEAGGPWWVQPIVDISSNGNWDSTVYFGRDPANYPEDSGKHFKISAIITSEKLTEGQQFVNIPLNVDVFEIKVVRK